MKKKLMGHSITLLLSSLILFGCNGGSQGSSSLPSLTLSQNVPNLFINQQWELKVHSNTKLVESMLVTLDGDYGLIATPSVVVLSPESPIAIVTVSSRVACHDCQVNATSSGFNSGSSNVFDVMTGQLPDYGGVSDLITYSGAESVVVSSTNGHVYTSTVDIVNNTSSVWHQISTIVPDDGAINSLDYDFSRNNVYASTSLGNSYVSLNESSQWKVLGGGVLPNNSMASATQIDSAGNLIIGTNNDSFVYVTSLNGTWQKLGGGALPDGGLITSDSAINITNLNNVESVFVGTSKGDVYVANIDPVTLVSNSWTLVGGSSVGKSITAINVNVTGNLEAGNVYVGTIRGEIYSSAGVNGSWAKMNDAQGGTTALIIIDSNSDVYTLSQYIQGSFSVSYSEAPLFSNWREFGLVTDSSVPDNCSIQKIVTSFPGKRIQFLGTMCGNVYYSTNVLQDWIKVGLPS